MCDLPHAGEVGVSAKQRHGRTLGDRLVLEGTNWLNLRFVTPLNIALRLGAPFLVARDVDPSAEGLGPALMMRLLLDVPEGSGYFCSMADQPTMPEALWATIPELRMAGIRADDLDAGTFEAAAKYKAVRALLAAYEGFLVRGKRGDVAVVYEEAIQHIDWCPIQGDDCWIELPDTLWSDLQLKLISALPGERIVPRAYSLAGVKSTAPACGRARSSTPPNPGIASLAYLLAPSSGATPSGSGFYKKPCCLTRREIVLAAQRNVTRFQEGAQNAGNETGLNPVAHPE